MLERKSSLLVGEKAAVAAEVAFDFAGRPEAVTWTVAGEKSWTEQRSFNADGKVRQ